MTTTRRRALTAGLALAALLAVAGCTGTHERTTVEPTSSPTPSPVSTAPAQAALDEALGWTDVTVAAVGEGRKWLYNPTYPWVYPVHASIYDYDTAPCGGADSTDSYFSFQILNHDPASDPVAILERVQTAWEAHGWHPRTVATTGDPAKHDAYTEIAVDFDEGAGFSFSVSQTGATSGTLAVTVQSRCFPEFPRP